MPGAPGCTLITDASFFCCGVAGWAAWARADGLDKGAWDGPISQTWVRTAADAELAAVLLGMRAVADYAPGHRLLVQSDCLRALGVMRQELGLAQSPHAEGLEVPDRVREALTEAEMRLLGQLAVVARAFPVVLVRHVKGHVPRARGLGRHRANDDCDQRAKAQMRALRQRFVEAQEARLACTT